MAKSQIPVLLLTGYLGSGKTTLLNRILNNARGIRFAVIVNDLGEVNIDADLIQKGGVVGQPGDGADDLVALQNGCICCTLKMDLIEQLTELARSGKFDYIVIEASGICEPAPIAQTIASIPALEAKYSDGIIPRLDCICTVVDALRLRDEFGCGDSLQRKDLDEEDIENLIIEQIEFCNIILLNKISEVSPKEADRIRAVIRAIQPDARIIDCDYCDVPLDDLLDTRLFNFEKVATSATWVKGIEGDLPASDDLDHDHDHHEHEHGHEHHHDHEHGEGEAEEYGVQTFVYYRRPPFDLNRFDYVAAKEWPAEIIRCKGVIYFNSDRDMSYLFETAGRQKKLTQAGLWFATAPKDELEQLMQQEPGLVRDWDPEYGDRMIKLVIIGRNLDRREIEARLDACLALA